MFIVAPYSTDAPLYHLPIATGSIIAVNTVIYLATTFQVDWMGTLDSEQIEWLMIQFNQINPLQWLTGCFMHLGFGHLLGNMLFLFCFGLVVEGKIGSLRFLALYLSCCVVGGALAQIPMFLMGSEGDLAGASGVISTLMVIALVWAPENEISFFYSLFLFLTGSIDVQIIYVCMVYIGLDLLSLAVSGFSMSGAMAHVLGALMGIPISVYFLRTGKVDCEGWDMISKYDWLQEYPLLYGKKQRNEDQKASDDNDNPIAAALALSGGDVSKSSTMGLSMPKKTEKRKQQPSQVVATPQKMKQRKRRKNNEVTLAQIVEKCQAHPELNRLAYVLRQCLESGNLPAAQQSFVRLDGLKIGLGLAETTLMRLATELVRQKQWTDAIRPLALLIEKQGTLADDACLRLAQIQLRVLKRKDLAIATLLKIATPDGGTVDASKREQIRKRDELLGVARNL